MPRKRDYAGAGGMGEGEINRDRLRAFLQHDSEMARRIVKAIDEEGYVVLEGILSAQEADAEYERMWGFVEAVAPTIKRSNPKSWAPPATRQEDDAWPCAQRDMFQLYQAGWVFTDLRERIAERVFAPLFGERALHVSKDGFTLQRPAKREPERDGSWDHFDQGNQFLGLHCIQGSVALTDQDETCGCFQVWPGSHKHRETLIDMNAASKDARDFIMLGEGQRERLRKAGLQPRRVPVAKGTVILWRSDVAHSGAPPIGRTRNFRAVAYVCCLPAVLTPPEVYAEKARAYQELQTGSHWPSREEWFRVSHRNRKEGLLPYLTEPPPLSDRQQQLHGLRPYSDDELADSAAQLERFHAIMEQPAARRQRSWGESSLARALPPAAHSPEAAEDEGGGTAGGDIASEAAAGEAGAPAPPGPCRDLSGASMYDEKPLVEWEAVGRQAAAAVRGKRWDEAERLTRASIAFRPDWFKGYLCLATVLRRKHEYSAAAAALEEGQSRCDGEAAAAALREARKALEEEQCRVQG